MALHLCVWGGRVFICEEQSVCVSVYRVGRCLPREGKGTLGGSREGKDVLTGS